MGSSVNAKDIRTETKNNWAAIEPDDSRYGERQGQDKKKKHKKKKESLGKRILRIVIYFVIIAILIFAVLTLIAYAAKYPSISAMLNHMWGELQLMGDRVSGAGG